jgi:hypothetical protein
VHEKSLKLNEILQLYIKYTAACLAETRSLVNNMLITLFKREDQKDNNSVCLCKIQGWLVFTICLV